MKRPFFRNLDLDIESASSLRSLANEFGDRVFVTFSGRMHGRHCLFLETGTLGMSQDSIINAVCGLIEGLSVKNRRLWDRAHRREFDCGYEARLSSGLPNRFRLRPRTLRRIAKLGAGLAVTLYREK